MERSKYGVLGPGWPSQRNHGSMRRAKEEFITTLEKQRFHAVFFDYDGTLSSSQRTDAPPPKTVLGHLERLVRSGVVVGIASCRGGSIQECLEKYLPSEVLKGIQLGLYNGGSLADATTTPVKPQETSEFLSQSRESLSV